MVSFSISTFYRKSKGFTLVELSISVMIIGLLVGGVFAGSGLLRQAKFRNLYAAVTEAKEAAKVFTARYDALPGDMKNAFMVFKGTACAVDADTCNGNGDGRIGYNDFSDETYMAWKHLGLSGIYAGQFSGTSGTNADRDFPAVNFKGAGLRWRYALLSAYDGLNTGNSLMLSGYEESLADGGLSPKDAGQFDNKYDDGIPATGSIIGFIGTNAVDGTACFTGTYAGSDTAYILASEAIGCILTFSEKL